MENANIGTPGLTDMTDHEYVDSSGTTVTAAHARITGEQAEDRLGSRLLSPGDVDGDGFADILISAHRAYVVPPGESEEVSSGAVYVLYGPLSGTIGAGEFTTLDAPAGTRRGGRISGLRNSAGFGASLAVGDFDGDGALDLATSAEDDPTGAGSSGAVFTFGSVFAE